MRTTMRDRQIYRSLRRRLRRRPELATENSLQEVLCAARVRHGLSRAQVAEVMGVDVEWVLAFESGDTDPRLSDIRLYAVAAQTMVRHAVLFEEGESES